MAGAVPADLGRSLNRDDLAAGFLASVDELGLIAVAGDDAASFLHGQLTNDVAHLGLGDVRLAGYCSAKGRLLATALMWRNLDTVFLQVPRSILPGLLKRLQMFVLRAKAKLRDASAELANEVVLGLGGAKAETALAGFFEQLPPSAYTRVEGKYGSLLRVADALGAPRYLWLLPADTAIAAWPVLAAHLAVGANDAWQLSTILAGVPVVTDKTLEQFVPQMVNYELLGGVNFKKGCYPGQEIVARSQYLGKLKRRTVLASIDQLAVQAGDDVFAAADPDQPCGMVVNAAPNGQGGVDVLVEIKLAALDAGPVHHGSAGGSTLAFGAMPYALDALAL